MIELAYAMYAGTVWWLVLRTYQTLHDNAEGNSDFQHRQFNNTVAEEGIIYTGSTGGVMLPKEPKKTSEVREIGVDSLAQQEKV